MTKRNERNRRAALADTAATRALEAVTRLDGFAPFHAYLQQLEHIREQLQTWDQPGLFPHRHLLVSINPGEGRTTLLTHLHAYLQQTGLFPRGRKAQTHDYPLVERVFALPVSNVIPEDTPFNELSEDLRYHKMGVVGLVMDDWPGRMDASPVRKLMAFCRENADRFLFVFFVPVLEPSVLEHMTGQLAEHIPTRLLRIAPATDEDLTALAVRKLAETGIQWDDSLNPLFRHLLIRERSDGRFHGRVTVMKLVTELQIARARNVARGVGTGPAWQTAPEDFDPMPALWQPPRHKESLAGMERLQALVGLENVKKQLLEIIRTMKLLRDRGPAGAERGAGALCHHLLFTGGPGTGKTEVARLFGQILREEGLLPVGDLLETNRYDLVGQCIGHTGPRTIAVCRAAMGSVLFVDEAYQLAAHEDAGSSRDYGQEALGALIAEMENHRDRFIVILAGYREEMEYLYRLNPGLRDRIPHMIHFPGYSRDELRDLYLSMAAGKGIPDEGLAGRVERYLAELPDAFLSSREFGNARFIRNLVERTVIKALMRCQGADPSEPLRLCVTDFEQVLAQEDLQTLNRDRLVRPIGFSVPGR